MEEYELERLLTDLSYQNWVTKELFSFGWFVIIAVLVVVYTVWLKLLDKSRVKDILLFGSLSSVGFILADIILGGYYGFYSTRISLFPIKPALFIVSITVTPVLFMLVYQYNASWKNYTIWLAICTAVVSLGLAPLYIKLGILEYHQGWNYSISFLRTFADGMIARAMVLWFTKVEESHPASRRISQDFSVLHPAVAKPFDKDNDNK